ncbi:MAG TPA: DUF3106 domain-containing protein [Candidatus Acidoferrales bacterium]
MKRTLQLAPLGLAAAIAMFACTSAFAQRKIAPPPPRPNAPRALPPPRPVAPVQRQMMGLPPKWVEQVQNMPPAQQERFLANNERFQSLPPQRQAQIRRTLQAWNNLTPEQRQTLQQREQILERMTPEQQRYVRNTLVPQWQSMPPARRQVIRRKLQQLQGLDETGRAAKLNDESFVNGLSPDEQQMLRGLSSLGSNEPPGM